MPSEGLKGIRPFAVGNGVGESKGIVLDGVAYHRLKIRGSESIPALGVQIVAQLIDLKAGATENDLNMMEWLSESGLDWFIVATKADKLNKTERQKAIEKLSALVDGVDIIPFSSLKGEGKAEVLGRISDVLGK